jgi:hypothetical protein
MTPAVGRCPAGQHGALRHGIDLAVGRIQRRHHQGAAQQALGVADRRHGDVDLAAGAGEGRQAGGDQHGRHVLRAELLAGDVDAQPLEDVRHDLLGEGGVAQPVAGAVQAHDQAVAHQVVAAHAVEFHQVLEPDLRRQGGRSQAEDDRQQAEHQQKAHRVIPGNW